MKSYSRIVKFLFKKTPNVKELLQWKMLHVIEQENHGESLKFLMWKSGCKLIDTYEKDMIMVFMIKQSVTQIDRWSYQ